MKWILPAILVLLAPSLSQAAGKTRRTMAELKTIALQQGDTNYIDAVGSRDLGLGDRQIATKEVWMDGRDLPGDGFIHTIDIITDSSAPQEFEWTVYRETTTANGEFVEGYEFLVSLKGKLLAGAQGIGIVGNVQRRVVPIPEARHRFEAEKHFWLQESVHHPWGS